jgi:hypothetical protein
MVFFLTSRDFSKGKLIKSKAINFSSGNAGKIQIE